MTVCTKSTKFNKYPACDVCSAEVRAFRDTASALAAGEAVDPPSSVRDAVMSEISRTRQLPPVLPDAVVDLAERRRERANRPVFLAAAAAAIVAIVGTLFAVRLGSSPDPVAEILAAPDVEIVPLTGASETILLAWSAERDEVALIADSLDSPGADQVYELWFLDGGEASPAGLFTPGDGGLQIVLTVDDRPADAFAVTVEPAGGSAFPTGDIVFLGEV